MQAIRFHGFYYEKSAGPPECRSADPRMRVTYILPHSPCGIKLAYKTFLNQSNIYFYVIAYPLYKLNIQVLNNYFNLTKI